MNINSVTLSGNLTRDPELKQAYSGTAICSMRMAVNDRRKNQQTGEWEDSPNYFDLDAFGKTAEACSNWLTRGSKIMVHGKLRWREWEKDGVKRQAVSVVVDSIEFPPKADQPAAGNHRDGQVASGQERAGGYTPAPEPPEADYADDDIPF